MGNQRRPRPKRLAGKLLAIRTQLGLSQEEMAKRFEKIPSPPDGAMISRFERDEREPSLFALLVYAHLAGVVVDVLIDDTIGLPQ